MPAVDKDWVVTAKISAKVLASRARATEAFREFVDTLARKCRGAGIVFFPDDWSGLLTGGSAVWENLSAEESAHLSTVIGGIPGFSVAASRGKK